MLTLNQPKPFHKVQGLRTFFSVTRKKMQTYFSVLTYIRRLQHENKCLSSSLNVAIPALCEKKGTIEHLQELTAVFRESNDVKVVINRWITAHCKYLNDSYNIVGQDPILQAHLKRNKQAAIRDFLANNAQYFDACDVCYIKDETGFDRNEGVAA